MRLISTWLLIFSLVYPASAWYTPLKPPPEYLPYTGELEVNYVHPADTSRVCKERPHVHTAFMQACSWRVGKTCFIVFPLDIGVYPKAYLVELMDHELAHCNKWRHE